MGEKEKRPRPVSCQAKKILSSQEREKKMRERERERERPMFGHKKEKNVSEKQKRIVGISSDLGPLTAVLDGVTHVSTFGGVCSYHPF
jgi:hypothetical protein